MRRFVVKRSMIGLPGGGAARQGETVTEAQLGGRAAGYLRKGSVEEVSQERAPETKPSVNLSKFNKTQLIEYARSVGVEARPTMTKPEIIAAIENRE